MNGTTEHREVEFKFRIPADVDLKLDDVLNTIAAHVSSEQIRSMDATYFDTENLNLLRWGITLRHRTGGGDDGWHMKVPADPSGHSSARDEIRVDKQAGSIPLELAAIAAPLIRRQEIVPMARVHTERKPFTVSGKSGTPILEVVDDRVEVTGTGPVVTFREVEVELLGDSAEAVDLADEIGQALRGAGARPSSLSKAAQALGRRAVEPPDVPELKYPDPSAPAVDALQAIFSRYVRDLLLADVGVRRDLPDSVHQMRVSCRRLRAALATFRSLLDSESASFLREELAWLATELGQVRDTEVQLATLGNDIDDEDSRAFVVAYLDQRLRAARSSALAALRSDRHDFLLEDLILLVSEPPVGPRAFEATGSTLAECVNKPWRKLHRSVDATNIDSSAEQWHRVRIQAKKARYAVEAVAPIFGQGFRRLGKSLSWVTDTLGSRQDAQVSIHTLQDIAATAPAAVAFRLGVRAAQYQVAGDEDVRAFLDRWPDIAREARKLGLD